MESKDVTARQIYWRENRRWMLILGTIWFVVSLGCGVLWVELNPQYAAAQTDDKPDRTQYQHPAPIFTPINLASGNVFRLHDAVSGQRRSGHAHHHALLRIESTCTTKTQPMTRDRCRPTACVLDES